MSNISLRLHGRYLRFGILSHAAAPLRKPRGGFTLTLQKIDYRQAPNEPAGLLILFICREIHPFAQRCFAFSIAFIQIQITIWVIKLTSLLPLLAECGFHNAKSSVAESATRCGVVCFLAVQDEILKEIFLIYCVCAFFIRVLGENLPVFIWKLFYFFLVPRVVGEGFAVGFCCRSPLHLSNSAQK